MNLSALRGATVLRTGVCALAAVLALTMLGSTAAAEPEKPSGLSSLVKDGRTWHLKVYSAAMGKDITVDVQRPVDESKPAGNAYLVSGLDAGEGTASWQAASDALSFLADKQVNVILPIGGRGSYYTDWYKQDPRLGLNKWKTFFTEELPPILDATLGSTGLNSLAGFSTSGTSVLQLAEAKPGLFKSVAAYSGCAETASPLGKRAMKLAVETWAGGNVVNMYGPDDDPAWVTNDPIINAEKLRGTNLYISSGSGLPTPSDVQYYQSTDTESGGIVPLFLGSVIEATTNICTHSLEDKLDTLGIPATYHFDPTGTHRWVYWQQALHDSWPLLAQGTGIES
ncbi:alpha/beta hydrolase [Nocardia sp. NPDC059240]|uniref:alpha/beta hydrolase n=1 Tax=Nocardia sp. NPDC059240 TaxID=3346786 RepID=UPI0036ADF38E